MRVKTAAVSQVPWLRPCIFCSGMLMRRSLVANVDRSGLRGYTRQYTLGQQEQQRQMSNDKASASKRRHARLQQHSQNHLEREVNDDNNDSKFPGIRKTRVDAPNHRIWKYTARAEYQPPSRYTVAAAEHEMLKRRRRSRAFARNLSSESSLSSARSKAMALHEQSLRDRWSSLGSGDVKRGSKDLRRKQQRGGTASKQSFRIHKRKSSLKELEKPPKSVFKYVNRHGRIRKYVHVPIRAEITDTHAQPVRTTLQDSHPRLARMSPRRRRARLFRLFELKAKDSSRGTQGYRDHMSKRARIQETRNIFTKYESRHPLAPRAAAMATHQLRKPQASPSPGQNSLNYRIRRSSIRKIRMRGATRTVSIRRVQATRPLPLLRKYTSRQYRLKPRPFTVKQFVAGPRLLIRKRHVPDRPPRSSSGSRSRRLPPRIRRTLSRPRKALIRRVAAAYLATPAAYRLSYFESTARNTLRLPRAPIVTQFIRALQRRSNYESYALVPKERPDDHATFATRKATLLDDVSRMLSANPRLRLGTEKIGPRLYQTNEQTFSRARRMDMEANMERQQSFERLLRRELERERMRTGPAPAPVTATGRLFGSLTQAENRVVSGDSEGGVEEGVESDFVQER